MYAYADMCTYHFDDVGVFLEESGEEESEVVDKVLVIQIARILIGLRKVRLGWKHLHTHAYMRVNV
jgi:hypothetical protein